MRAFSKCLCYCICLCHCLCLYHCLFVGQGMSLITLIKCLKDHESLGMLSGNVFINGHLLIFLLAHSVTRSPVELSWGQLKTWPPVVPLLLLTNLATRWRHLQSYISWDCHIFSWIVILASSSARVTLLKGGVS